MLIKNDDRKHLWSDCVRLLPFPTPIICWVLISNATLSRDIILGKMIKSQGKVPMRRVNSPLKETQETGLVARVF